MELSDHCPILLSTDVSFVEAWASNKTSFKVVENAWNVNWKDGMANHQQRKSLFKTSRALQKMNKEQFGFAHLKIKQLKVELGCIQEGE